VSGTRAKRRARRWGFRVVRSGGPSVTEPHGRFRPVARPGWRPSLAVSTARSSDRRHRDAAGRTGSGVSPCSGRPIAGRRPGRPWPRGAQSQVRPRTGHHQDAPWPPLPGRSTCPGQDRPGAETSHRYCRTGNGPTGIRQDGHQPVIRPYSTGSSVRRSATPQGRFVLSLLHRSAAQISTMRLMGIAALSDHLPGWAIYRTLAPNGA
jgi:hypothetical protein